MKKKYVLDIKLLLITAAIIIIYLILCLINKELIEYSLIFYLATMVSLYWVLKGVEGFAVIIFLLFALIPSDYSTFLSISTPFAKFPLYIILVFLYTCLVIIRDRKIKMSEITKLLIILLFVAMVSLALNFDEKYIFSVIKYFILSLCSSYIISNKAINHSIFINTIKVICLIASIVSVLAVAESLFNINVSFLYNNITGENYRYWQEANMNFLWRANSTIGNSVVLGCFLSFALPLTMLLKEKGFKYGLVLYAINAVGLILTVSKSAWLFLLMYSIYKMLLVSKKRLKSLIILGLLSIFIKALLKSIPYTDMMIERVFQSFDSITYLHRSNAYTHFANIFFNNNFIIGEGIAGSYVLLEKEIYKGGYLFTNTLDNAWLDNTLALGLVGLIIILLLFRQLILQMRTIKNFSERTAYIEIIFVFIYYSMFFDTFRYQASWGTFWVIISLFIALTSTKKLVI